MSRIEELTAEEIAELEQRLGRAFLVAPLIAKQVGHKHPLHTLRDYVLHTDNETRVECALVDFIHDVTSMKTEELCAKWWPKGAESRLLGLGAKP